MKELRRCNIGKNESNLLQNCTTSILMIVEEAKATSILNWNE
jgi:hypothetical protein